MFVQSPPATTNSTSGQPHDPLMSGVSVVIPVFNSAQTVGAVVDEVCRELGPTGEFEIILVDDGSRDESWEVLCGIANVNPHVRCMRLHRNYGQHSALLCGLRHASYSMAVTMDDDGQHPARGIPVLLDKLSDEVRVVYGIPRQAAHSGWRNVTSKLTKVILSKSLGVDQLGQTSAFRAFRTEIIHGLGDFRSPHVSLDVLLSWGTSGFETVRVEHRSRQHGESNYTLRLLMDHALVAMTTYSVAPLRLATYAAMTCLTGGAGLIVWSLGKYVFGGSASETSGLGLMFVIAAIMFLGGLQLLALGIIGEYLGRLYQRMLDRPPYLIRSSTVPVGEELSLFAASRRKSA